MLYSTRTYRTLDETFQYSWHQALDARGSREIYIFLISEHTNRLGAAWVGVRKPARRTMVEELSRDSMRSMDRTRVAKIGQRHWYHMRNHYSFQFCYFCHNQLLRSWAQPVVRRDESQVMLLEHLSGLLFSSELPRDWCARSLRVGLWIIMINMMLVLRLIECSKLFTATDCACPISESFSQAWNRLAETVADRWPRNGLLDRPLSVQSGRYHTDNHLEVLERLGSSVERSYIGKETPFVV